MTFAGPIGSQERNAKSQIQSQVSKSVASHLEPQITLCRDSQRATRLAQSQQDTGDVLGIGKETPAI